MPLVFIAGLLGILLGTAAGVALLLAMFRLADGEWMWQQHLRSKCRCGVLYPPTERCAGARMGRNPRSTRRTDMRGPEERRAIADAYIARISTPNQPPRPWQVSHARWLGTDGALHGGWQVRDTGANGRDRVLADGLPDRAAAQRWIAEQKARK
jgi:hypothetical protein